MAVLAHKVYGDRYEIGKFPTISYKVFSAKDPNDSYIHLLQAQVAMHYEDESYLVHATGKELWTFAEPGGIPPEPPTNLGFFLVTKGVILASNATTGNEAARPWAFLKAVQTRVLNQLVHTMEENTHFGNSIYSKRNGTLLNVTPALSRSGELSVRLVVENAELFPVKSKDTSIVWLLPLGRQARLLDTPWPSSVMLSRQFYSAMSTVCHFSRPTSFLDESPWIRVSVDGQEVIWPADLAVAKHPRDQSLSWLAKSDPYTTLSDAMLDMREAMKPKLNKPESNNASIPPAQPPMYVAPPVAPPPPTPSASTGQNFVPDAISIYPTPNDISPDRHIVPADSVESWQPPTTENPKDWEMDDDQDEVTIADFNYFDLPVTANEPKDAENDILMSDDLRPLKRTKTETNVDEPYPSREHHMSFSSVVSDTAMPPIESSPSKDLPLVHTTPNSKSAFAPLEFNQSASLSLDSKYLIGGRYFTPKPAKDEDDESAEKVNVAVGPKNEDVAEEGEEDEDDDDEEDEDDEGDDSYLLDFDEEGRVLGESVAATPDVPNVQDDRAASPESSWRGISRTQSQQLTRTIRKNVSQYAEAFKHTFFETDPTGYNIPGLDYKHVDSNDWISVLTMPDALPPGDTISNDNLQYLMSQVVWDNGMLHQLVDGPLPSGDLGLPDERLLSQIRVIYPGLRRLSVADTALTTASFSSAGTPVTSTPVMPGIDPPIRKTVGGRTDLSGHSFTETPSPAPNSSEEPAFTLLSPPLYSVTRMDQPHKARAAILRFWKIFGLQPNSGPRDITLIHLTLASSRILEGTRRMLGFLKSTYEGCGLGKLDLPSFGSISKGILNISADLEYTNPDTVGDLFETLSSYLKRQLTGKVADKNILIFMAYPPNARTSPLPLARGFQALRTSFKNVRWLLTSLNTLAARTEADVLPSQYDMVRLALLIYDRWVSRLNVQSQLSSGRSAFSLARLVPHSINVKFTPEVPSQIFDEDPVMHISYAVSADSKWVAVAWSDQWASISKIEVFRLAGHTRTRANSPVIMTDNSSEGVLGGGSSSSLNMLGNLKSTFSDIWKRTMTLCNTNSSAHSQSRWRIAVVKSGPMDVDELDLWLKTGDIPPSSRGPITTLYVLALPYSRPIRIRDSAVLFNSGENAVRTVASTAQTTPFSPGGAPQTPSTPLNAASSPINPSTPGILANTGQRPRNDNVIVSASDETHGIVFDNNLHILYSSFVQATGVLVKPLNGEGHEGHQHLEVHLIHTPTQPKQMMKQILGQYRRLASLAETTGVTTDAVILPWHVEATNKMIGALASL